MTLLIIESAGRFTGSETRRFSSILAGMRGTSTHVGIFVSLLLVFIAASDAGAEITRIDPPRDYLVEGSFRVSSKTSAAGLPGPLDSLLNQKHEFTLLLRSAEIQHELALGAGAGATIYSYHPESFELQFSGPDAALLNSLVGNYLTRGGRTRDSVLSYSSLIGEATLALLPGLCDGDSPSLTFSANNGVFIDVPPMGTQGFPYTTQVTINLPAGITYTGSLEVPTARDALTISPVPEPGLAGVMVLVGMGMMRRRRAHGSGRQ